MPVHLLEYYINRSWIAALSLATLALVLGAFAYVQHCIAYVTGAGGAEWLIAGITPLLMGLTMPLFAYAAGAVINQAMPSADDMRHQAVWAAFGQAMGAIISLFGIVMLFLTALGTALSISLIGLVMLMRFVRKA